MAVVLLLPTLINICELVIPYYLQISTSTNTTLLKARTKASNSVASEALVAGALKSTWCVATGC